MSSIKIFIESTIGIDIFNLYGTFASIIGLIASIIGLIITIFIFVRVRKIHSEYLSRIRIPDIKRNIEDRYKNIAIYRNNIDASVDEIKKELVICNASLKSLKHKAPILRKGIIKLSKKINKFVSPNFINKIINSFINKSDSDVVRAIHNQLAGLIAEIDDYMQDQQWRMTS